MGMYTELMLSTYIKNDPVVIEILKYLTRQTDVPPSKLPDHLFFHTDRWPYILTQSSYYFVPRSVQLFEYDHIAESWVLITRSDLKNYTGEIDHFIDWLSPYIDHEYKTMIGYHRYEEDFEPTIIYAGPND